MSSVSSLKFPQKLYKIVSECNTGSIKWNTRGDAIIISFPTFQKEYLFNNAYFKTSQMTSFVRSLNIYGFEKLRTERKPHTAGQNEYRHEKFLRGQPNLLQFVTRKVGNSMMKVNEKNSAFKKKCKQTNKCGETKNMKRGIKINLEKPLKEKRIREEYEEFEEVEQIWEDLKNDFFITKETVNVTMAAAKRLLDFSDPSLYIWNLGKEEDKKEEKGPNEKKMKRSNDDNQCFESPIPDGNTSQISNVGNTTPVADTSKTSTLPLASNIKKKENLTLPHNSTSLALQMNLGWCQIRTVKQITNNFILQSPLTYLKDMLNKDIVQIVDATKIALSTLFKQQSNFPLASFLRKTAITAKSPSTNYRIIRPAAQENRLKRLPKELFSGDEIISSSKREVTSKLMKYKTISSTLISKI